MASGTKSSKTNKIHEQLIHSTETIQTQNDSNSDHTITKHGFTTSETRSNIMKKIKGRDTVIEKSFRLIFWHKGFRYRINDRKLPGKPDIVFPQYRVVVFIDGEFWHGYNWANKKNKIKSNRDYWIKKIEGNMKRDRDINNKLIQAGWIVLRFWENEIKSDLDRCVSMVLKHLNKSLSK